MGYLCARTVQIKFLNYIICLRERLHILYDCCDKYLEEVGFKRNKYNYKLYAMGDKKNMIVNFM